ETNLPGDSHAEFGPTSLYGQSSPVGPTVQTAAHSVTLLNLLPSTTYHYRVRSEELNGIVAFSGDNTFTTPAVVAGPACTLSASPSTITSGGASTLSWTTSGSPRNA